MTAKNFMWVILDSLRGDRTSIGGHNRGTTPTLREIGEEANGFAGMCFSHAIWSQPSVASMLTGTVPSTHGSGSHNEKLPNQIPTVAERLSENGYRTIAVSSNPYFSEATGMHRGFDKFEFLSGSTLVREAGLGNFLSFLSALRTFSGGFEFDKRKHSPDFLLNEIIKSRLREGSRGDIPFFLVAHYNGAHHPYFPSPKYRGSFETDLQIPSENCAQRVFELSSDIYSGIAEGRFDDDDTKAMIRNMYDAQVTQVDALVSNLLSSLEQIGIAEDTIVVITSDHGDLLGEMGLFSHKLALHDALIKVPIAVRGSDFIAEARGDLIQHTDVMQTILTELGIETSGMQGYNLDENVRGMAVAQRGEETYQKTMSEIREYDANFDHDHVLPGFVTALRTKTWKYVSSGQDANLYRLPDENTNVSDQYSNVAKRFKHHMSKWHDEYGDTVLSNKQAGFDQEAKDLLADLGYIQS